MTIRVVDKVQLVKAVTILLAAMFLIGVGLGSCSLGMKLPVALLDLATRQ